MSEHWVPVPGLPGGVITFPARAATPAGLADPVRAAETAFAKSPADRDLDGVPARDR